MILAVAVALGTQLFLPWAAQSGPEVEVVTAIGGHRFDVAVVDEVAYVASGTTLHVVDITDVERPQLSATSPPDRRYMTSVAINADRSIVAGIRSNVVLCRGSDEEAPNPREVLEIYDAATLSPQGATTLPADWCHTSTVFLDDWVVMIGRSLANKLVVRFADLSDPTEPRLLDGVSLPDVEWPRDLTTDGSLLFIAYGDPRLGSGDGDGGVLVLERIEHGDGVLDLRAHVPLAMAAVGIDIRDGILAVATDAARQPFAPVPGATDSLMLFEVSEPSNPSHLSTVDAPLGVSGVALGDGIAVVHGGGGAAVFDVRSPGSPALVMAHARQGAGEGNELAAAVAGRRIVVADGHAVRTWHLDHAGNVAGGDMALPGITRRAWLAGSLAAVDSDASSRDVPSVIQLVDVSDLAHPRPLGFIGPRGFGSQADRAVPSLNPRQILAGADLALADPEDPNSPILWLGIWGATLCSVDLSAGFSGNVDCADVHGTGKLHIGPPEPDTLVRQVVVGSAHRVILFDMEPSGQLTGLSEVRLEGTTSGTFREVIRIPGHVLVVLQDQVVALEIEADRLIEDSAFNLALGEIGPTTGGYFEAPYLYLIDSDGQATVHDLSHLAAPRLLTTLGGLSMHQFDTAGSHTFWTGRRGHFFTGTGYFGVVHHEPPRPPGLHTLGGDPFFYGGLAGFGDQLVVGAYGAGLRLMRVTRR